MPAAPDKYEIALPADFKPPEGVDFKFNADDPLLAQARTLFHEIDQGKIGGQEAFSRALALVAGSNVATQQQITNARNAEIAKLGVNGPARIDALTTLFKAQLGANEGAQLMSRVFTASDVQVMEKLASKMMGAGSFSTSGREPQENNGNRLSNEAYAKLSNAEKLDYARKFDQSQFTRAA